MWCDLLMVHGKPKHPQSGISDVKDMLIAWLGDNDKTDWSTGLRFVQFEKNNSYHSDIKQSPFKTLSSQILERLSSEDYLT